MIREKKENKWRKKSTLEKEGFHIAKKKNLR